MKILDKIFHPPDGGGGRRPPTTGSDGWPPKTKAVSAGWWLVDKQWEWWFS